MSPLVKKEIRLLLPAWIAAMLLAVASFLLTIGNAGDVVSDVPIDLHILFLLLGATLLSIASFGQEFSSGTFTLSLSQPIERHRIWTIKTTLLALAYASVFLTLLVSWELHLFHLHCNWRVLWTISKYVGLSALCAFVFFSGGLCTTLLLRRISEAFWLTLLTPVILMAMVFAISEYFHWPDQVNDYFVPAVFLVYSLAGFFWARRLFLRAQDLQWTGGEIIFPSRRAISGRITFSDRRRHWLSALVRKELQLQQVNILIATVVFILHLTSVLIRRFHPNFSAWNVSGLLELFWAFWLAMPLLIGSAAVAEEHRIGIIDSQFCLPVSRRTQFFVKFFLGLILSLVLGGLMPFVVERGHGLNFYVFIVAAGIFFISFYASTLMRTTLQAIGLAMVAAFAIYFFEVAKASNFLAFHQYQPNRPIGLELLKLFLGIPILFFVLARLMYWNFKWLHENWKSRRRNLIVILTAFVTIFILTNSIYFRAWEFVTPTRPPHGPARLHSANEVKFAAYGNTLYATLPDGRLWVGTLAIGRATHQLEPKWDQAEFVGGSNWVTVATDGYQTLGIQSNGSLWHLQRQWNPSNDWRLQTGAFQLTRMGSDTNWSQAAGGMLGFLLLQKDGTLWVWGTNAYAWREASNTIPQKLELDLVTPPARIGTESNWAEIFVSGDRRGVCARNNTGSILELSAEWKRNFEYPLLQSTNISGRWLRFTSQGWADVGIKTNGELWLLLNDWTNNTFIPTGRIQLGQGSKWQAVAFDYIGFWSITALRNDGTLWEWPVAFATQNRPVSVGPVRLGNHSDWVALYRCWGLTFTLAADGSLWSWDEPSRHVWLAPPRKPVYLGNIFNAS
ncbi:MAG TPA: ABC transporter permease [Candidatus Acidoferrales bacterium]|nr:ABC transporter permease [Candidatus Acidoferrales bacterium]